MKDLFKLQEERASLLERMEATVVDEMTDEQRSAYDTLSNEMDMLNADIERAEKLAKLKENISTVSLRNDLMKPENEETNFVRGLSEYANGGVIPSEMRGRNGIIIPQSVIFRADPMLSTTQTGLTEKTVGALNIKTSKGEAFLRSLGVNIQTGLIGQYVLPSAPEPVGNFVAEASTAGSADFNPSVITLAGRRLPIQQTFTKEYRASVNSNHINTMVAGMMDALWVAVAKDVFVQIKADGAAAQIAHVGGTLGQDTILAMEASLGYMGDYKLATTKALAKPLKKWNSTHGGRVWDNNIAEGYPAFAENVVSAGNLFLGDFRDVTVGQFQNVEMIVDPYTMAAEGKIKIVIDSLFDSGLANYRGFTWISDASVY